ncbi:unnamed protein product [Ascophyllum nodosum]
MTTEATSQGEVTVHDFRGLLGTLGWGWLHPRFLVLGHSVVLVYASCEDWAEHREPLDDIALSADSTVEISQEGGESLVCLRCPGHAPLTFNGATDDTEAPTSKLWNAILALEISRLRRERNLPDRAAAKNWQLWNVFGTSLGRSSVGASRGRGRNTRDTFIGPSVRTSISSNTAPEGGPGSTNRVAGVTGVEEEKGQGVGGPRERERARAEGSEGRSGNHGDEGGGDAINDSGASFRRWPLQKKPSKRRISFEDGGERDDRQVGRNSVSDGESAPVFSGALAAGARRRGGRSLGGSEHGSFWDKARGAFGGKDGKDCDCKWCRTLGSGRYSHNANPAPKIGSLRRRSSWAMKRASSSMQTSAVVQRWELLVLRWTALQLARAGDTPGMTGFLRKFPDFPDKANLLRAAVRYRQYSLVQYFLDEQDMDVNLMNSMGIPLVWFSVLNALKGDSGVMLRYLLQRGADIRAKSHLGQNVLFMVAFSRGKEAIPTLKYLVEEYGLSLTDSDNFGSEPIHWAVLHGHLDTVQWISRYTRHRAARADWSGVFQKMENIRLVKPEHVGAVRSWRMRGLQKSARSLTPLGVAILHNHEDIAKWLMGYRTDHAECIACKRDNLFREENRDLSLVVKTWPELLPEVLQGFEVEDSRPKSSWDTDDKRKMTPTGWSERIYDLKLLFGPPEVPANRSPLSIFLSAGQPSLFDVKIVQLVVALKWSVFGQRYYLWEIFRFSALSLAFILGFIVWSESPNWVGPLRPGDEPLHVIGGSLSRGLCWILTLYNLLVEEGRELKAAKSFRKYILDDWNLQSVVAYGLVLSLMAVFKPWEYHGEWETGVDDEYTANGMAKRLVTAPAALFLFTRCMEHLAVWKSTGVFIAVIRMMIVDTASWAVIFILFEAGFGLAFYALLKGNAGFKTMMDAMVTVFVLSMGEITTPFSENSTLNSVAVMMFILFMLLVAIVYINLLVAMMTSSYTTVVNGATAQAMMNRAAALVKWEGIMSDRERRKAFSSVAPAKGKRVHISLKGWFGGGVTEVFCSQEGAIAVEPEQGSIGKAVDPIAVVMKELSEIREMMGKSSKRGLSRLEDGEGGSFSFSSDIMETSFRRRQAGMLDANGNELSRLRITNSRRLGSSTASMTSEDMLEWRRKAREVEAQADSRRGVVRAQALIRGYLSRSKTTARFSSAW